MTGHRKRTGKLRKPELRAQRFQRLLADAETVEEQASIAFDWWRSAARHSGTRLDDFQAMAHHLANAAHQLDRRPR